MVRPQTGSDMVLQAPKEYASEYLLGVVEADVGTWSGLDESGVDKVGVGLFFKIDRHDGAVRVVSLVPGSSAHCSGLITVGDKLLDIDNEGVFGMTLIELRDRIHGLPGSFVVLDFERQSEQSLQTYANKKKFRVNVMRGSPQFIAYQDRFGIANASRLDELVLQKREEQKFNGMVERQLKIEQGRFAKAQARRREVEEAESQLRYNLEQLQKELYEEEQKFELAKEAHRVAQQELEDGPQPGTQRSARSEPLNMNTFGHDLTKALSFW